MTPQPPLDFRDWSSHRLKFLLEEYRSALASSRVLLGKADPETLNYERWIKALEEELARRGI